MASEKVKGEDSPPVATVNVVEMLAGEYVVTAPKGIKVSGHKDTIKKGEKVELNGDAARALLNEGSIKRA